MSNDGKLRGFAALVADQKKRAESGGKRGRKLSGGSPVNVSAALIAAMGKPVSARELCLHSLALGLWTTAAAKPISTFTHPLSSACKTESESGETVVPIFDRPSPGMYAMHNDDYVVIPIVQSGIDPATGYVAIEPEFDDDGELLVQCDSAGAPILYRLDDNGEPVIDDNHRMIVDPTGSPIPVERPMADFLAAIYLPELADGTLTAVDVAKLAIA